MGEKGKILVIDDDEDVRALLKAMLEEEFDVDLAVDGQQALDFCNTNRYIAVVIDIALPGTYNGFQLVEEVRKLDYSPSIILITGLALEPEVRKKTAEADAFIMKPFSIDEIIEVIHEALAKSKAS